MWDKFIEQRNFYKRKIKVWRGNNMCMCVEAIVKGDVLDSGGY